MWLSCAAILYNLDRFSFIPRLGWPYFIYTILVPAVVLITAYAYGRRKRGSEPVEKVRQEDIVAETEEVEA